MNRMPTSTIDLCRIGAALAVAMLTLACSIPHAAADNVSDPKRWCDDATKLVADKSILELIDRMAGDSNGWLEKSVAAQYLAGLSPVLSRAGKNLSSDLLAERRYGEALARFWYILVFEKGAFYFRCEAIKYGDHWVPVGVHFQSDPSLVGLP